MGLAALTALACALIWIWTPGMTILGDEWRYAHWIATEGALGRGFDPDVGKYAIPVPLIVYGSLFDLFGLGSHMPFRLMSFLLLVLVVGLFYELIRRRVGYLWALPAVALVLFLGTSAEVLATSLRSPAMMALAASLAALLLLERDEPKRDLAAAGMLIVAVASHPGGLAFCTAAGILLMARPAASWRDRARQAWVFAVPIGVFLVALRPAPDDRLNGPSLGERIAGAPGYLADGLSGLLARMSGVYQDDLISLGSLGGNDSIVGWALTVALGAAVIGALARRRPFPWPLLAFLACALMLMGAALLAPGGTRSPNLERYVLPAAIMILLVVAELLKRHNGASLRLGSRRAVLGVTLALVAFAIASNAATLERRANQFNRGALELRAEALGYELARDLKPRGMRSWDEKELRALVGNHRFPLLAAEYYAVLDDYGSPALEVTELDSRSESVRRTVALVLSYVATDRVPASVLAAIGAADSARDVAGR